MCYFKVEVWTQWMSCTLAIFATQIMFHVVEPTKCVCHHERSIMVWHFGAEYLFLLIPTLVCRYKVMGRRHLQNLLNVDIF